MNELKLSDVVGNLQSYDEASIIFANKPWKLDSRAIVVKECDDGTIRDSLSGGNAQYFLEVFIAKEFLDGWKKYLDYEPSLQEQCERLIKYAINDA